jgi:diguanylate cyclase (GGDEF)-like protein
MALGIICSAAMSILIYFQYKNYIDSSMDRTLIDAGRLIESQMPILSDIEYIRQEGLARTDAYEQILAALENYKDAFGFTFIYLIENSREGFFFLLDTDKVNNTFHQAYNANADIFKRVIDTQEIIISGIYTDEFGTFNSAFIPIKRDGEVVSILGLDFEVSLVHTMERRAVLQIAFSLVITVSFVMIMAVIVSLTFAGLVRKTENLNDYLISANKKLEELSTIDELTRLYNRRAFLEYLGIVWKQNQRLNLPLTALMLDVDYFKKYNDALGHLEGDKALVAIAQCMREMVKRETDFVARFGGEEFVCLLPFTSADEAFNFAANLVASIEAKKIPHPDNEVSEYLTISAGMASLIPDSSNSYMQLLEDADKALYMAKAAGRNRVAIF